MISMTTGSQSPFQAIGAACNLHDTVIELVGIARDQTMPAKRLTSLGCPYHHRDNELLQS